MANSPDTCPPRNRIPLQAPRSRLASRRAHPRPDKCVSGTSACAGDDRAESSPASAGRYAATISRKSLEVRLLLRITALLCRTRAGLGGLEGGGVDRQQREATIEIPSSIHTCLVTVWSPSEPCCRCCLTRPSPRLTGLSPSAYAVRRGPLGVLARDPAASFATLLPPRWITAPPRRPGDIV